MKGLLKDKILLILISVLILSILISGYFMMNSYNNPYLYDISKIHWFQYNVSIGSDLPESSLPVEFPPANLHAIDTTAYDTVAYGGITNARYMNETSSLYNGAGFVATTVTQLYFDPSDNYRLLGGYWNNSAREVIVQANDPYYREKDPIVANLNVSVTSLVSSGTETITVPAGTFQCTNYTISEGEGKVIYYHANNVPVPVKITYISKPYDYVFPQKYRVYNTYELVDYG